MSGLSPRHLEQLRASGLDDETIRLNQLSTSDSADDIRAKLNWQAQPSGRWTLGSCLVFPMVEPGSATPYAHRVRPDNPRRDKNGKARKYESPVGAGVLVFFPARARQHGWLVDASRPLVWTEGEKKSMLLDQLGHACVGLTGVWNAHDPEARTRGEGFVLHPLIRNHVAVAGRAHVICFDSDAHAKPEVMQAARVLAGMLFAAGATHVCFATPPEGLAKGIDDYFVACHSGDAATDAVRALLEAAEELDRAAVQPPSRPRVRAVRFYRDAPVPERLRVPPGYELRDDGSLWKGNDDDAELVAQRAVLVSGAARDEDGVYRVGVVSSVATAGALAFWSAASSTPGSVRATSCSPAVPR